MTRYLLDVNVLIALVDPAHVQHHAAHEWFSAVGNQAFATCAVTEMGLLRIVGHPRYPNSPGSPAAVAPLLAGIRALPGHAFWADAVSPMDTQRLDAQRLLDSSQVTDSHLLALAVAHQGHLASFDRRLVTSAVPGGAQALLII